jgi:dTDP-D-glucose 4,6-dehydratase
LELVLYLFNIKKENPLMAGQEPPLENDNPGAQVFLKTVDEVVESVLSELRSEERSILAQTSEENLPILTHVLASFIDTKIGDSTLNQELIEDCRRRAGNPDLYAAEASKVIIEAVWERVWETHRLRVVK